MDWLFPLYICTTIFGAGVTIIDLLGLIGHHADQEAGADHSFDHSGDHGFDHDTTHAVDDSTEHGIDHDTGHYADHDPVIDTDHGVHHADDHDASHPGDHSPGSHGSGQESVVVHDHTRARKSPVFLLLSLARSIVYFCLGFGPVGWFGVATGMDKLVSLAWSIPFGLAAVFGTRALRNFMRKDLDSQVKEEELIMEKGVIIVSVNKGALGKVRVRLGGLDVERYARAKEPGKSFPVGAEVRVVDITEDCIIVDDEE